MPYTLPQDHTLLISLGETTSRVCREKLAYLRTLAGMAMLVTHPDYLAFRSVRAPERIGVYESFLEHLKSQTDCWHALPVEIAQWWTQRDSLGIDRADNISVLVGPMAEKAKLIKLRDLTEV